MQKWLLVLFLWTCSAAVLPGISYPSENPNDSTSQYNTVDTTTGKRTVRTTYKNRGGVLSNNFAIIGDKAYFTAINISTTVNIFYTADAQSGAIQHAHEFPLYHILPATALDLKSKKLYGILQMVQETHLAVYHDGNWKSVLKIGKGYLTAPGVAAFNSGAGEFYTVVQDSNGVQLMTVKTGLLPRVDKLATLEPPNVMAIAWDNTQATLYVLGRESSSASTLYTVSPENGKVVKTICKFPGYPYTPGGLALDSNKGILYIALSTTELKQHKPTNATASDPNAIFTVNLGTGKFKSVSVDYQPTDLWLS